MKKLKIWSMMMLAVMVLPLVVSCGGDDDSTDSKWDRSNLVDGVNVNKRQLLTVNVAEGYFSLKMNYDAHGKLTNIIWTENNKDYEGLTIDYDLRVIRYLDKMKYAYVSSSLTQSAVMASCRFTLNDRGYISQIDDCNCTYDDEGYLVGVTTSNEMWTLTYSGGDVVKSLTEGLISGKLHIYTFNYSEDSSKGEFYFTCKDFSADRVYRTIIALVAYHSGLFGKISKHCTMLPNSTDPKTFIDWNNYKESEPIKCAFTFRE